MATERFEKLKSKKKKLVLDSISNCLFEKSVVELSVMDIAKEAEISRGTFYTYFSDKDDAIITLIKDKIREYIEILKGIVTNNNGDLFKSIIETFDIMKSNFDEYHKKISNNILSVVNTTVLINYIHDSMHEMEELNKWMIDNTDVGKKYFTNNQDINNLMELISFAISTAILRLSLNSTDKDIDYDFKLKIKIIKNGINIKNI